MALRTFLVLLPMLVLACSQDIEGTNGTGKPTNTSTATINAESVCTLLTTCEGNTITKETCVASYEGQRVSQACADRVNAFASCSDSADGVTDLCYPACDPATAPTTCNSDNTITSCADTGRQFTFTCDGVCALNKSTWTGTCATSYQGQDSSNGKAKCWCN